MCCWCDRDIVSLSSKFHNHWYNIPLLIGKRQRHNRPCRVRLGRQTNWHWIGNFQSSKQYLPARKLYSIPIALVRVISAMEFYDLQITRFMFTWCVFCFTFRFFLFCVFIWCNNTPAFSMFVFTKVSQYQGLFQQKQRFYLTPSFLRPSVSWFHRSFLSPCLPFFLRPSCVPSFCPFIYQFLRCFFSNSLIHSFFLFPQIPNSQTIMHAILIGRLVSGILPN